jgi:hypothetical protein
VLTYRRIAVVGSREFKNYKQLSDTLNGFNPETGEKFIEKGDWIVSGGALGADSMAQRWAKETGHPILIFYPDWSISKGAGFLRNAEIVQNADIVLAFYRKDHFQEGGTSNTAGWARKLNVPLYEFEEL